MKKIMLPLLLLLLLMLFCVWKHAGDFNKPVTYTITQESQSYRLKGSFKEESQIQRLIKVFAKNGASLKGADKEVDSLLNAKGSVGVVEKITAHFIKNYKEGQLSYAAETLTVSGIVESDAANEQMQTLLLEAPISVVNETKVVKPLPIEFVIKQKAAGEYILSGDFSSTTEKDRLITSLKSAGAKVRVAGGINPILAERDDVIATVEKVIPHFVKNLQEGEISYLKGELTVSGLAMEKPLLESIEKDLYGAKVKFHTDLALNLKAIKAKEEAIRKAKELAAKKAAEAKRKAEQERLAQEEAARKAKAEAAKRAEEERLAREEAARREAEAKQKAQEERLAQEAAAKKAEEERQAQLAAQAAQKAEQERLAQEEAARKAEAAARKAEEERQAKIAEALLQAQQEADARKAAQEARKAAASKMAVAPVMSAEEIAKIKANRQAARENIAKLLEVEIIEFDTAKSSLTAKGENTVDKLALILQNYPLIKVEIAGHTDSDGNDKFNQKLSQARVDTVKKELVSQGINAHRLKAIGYGESKPLVPNTTAENKQKNRRVEIIVIGE